MAENCFHPSIEGAQHGAKSLAQFLDYAKKSGASGAQPSNYMLTTDKGLMSAKDIKSAFSTAKLTLDGVSAHCPIWVHTTAWTASPTIRPFTPADVALRIDVLHNKNFGIRRGLAWRMMNPGSQKRAMHFVEIPSGD